MARSFKRPDEAAMQRVFARTSGGAAEVVLRLAWLQGLHRAEITALRWDQVDFAGRALLLPDRTIPLDPSAEACLRAWYVRCAGNPECVAVSDRDQTPMRPESVSRLARQALNSEGLALSLLDLRRDFILRQIEVHGWSHAAQVSGVAAAALREEFLPWLRAANTLRPRRTKTSGNTSSGASSSRRAAPRRGWRCGWAGSCGCSPARSPD